MINPLKNGRFDFNKIPYLPETGALVAYSYLPVKSCSELYS